MKKLFVSALAAAFSAASFASAILSPTAVISNTAGEYAAGDLAHVHDQSGLSAGFTSGVTDFDTYLAGNPTHTDSYPGFEWFSIEDVTAGTIVFDLGADYLVDRFALWNEEYTGLASVTVTTSLLLDFSSSAGGGTHNPANSPLGSGYPAEVFALDGGARATRYVKLDLTGPQPGFLYNGLSMGEIAFSVNPVPEPATMAVLCAGTLALLRRKTRR